MMIRSTSYDQHEIIKNIIELHCPSGIECDPTYSKGNFYKDADMFTPAPRYKFDLFPQTECTVKSSAETLPLEDGSIKSIMFDPPFIVGHTKDKPTGIIGERFHGFRYIKDLWQWYSLCIEEHHRVLQSKGIYIFKCQDTVSSGKQHLSHVHVITEMQRVGFYVKDLFVLLAKNRIIGHNHKNQKHARKFHSYFIVAEKQVSS